MKFDPRVLVTYYQRLAPRERVLLGLSVMATVLIGLYSFVWDPLQANAELTTRRIAMKEKDLSAMVKQRPAARRLPRGTRAFPCSPTSTR
jgi:type II secretory pathway component PulM